MCEKVAEYKTQRKNIVSPEVKEIIKISEIIKLNRFKNCFTLKRME